jgi:hypothetical protein
VRFLVYWGNRREEADACAVRLQTMIRRLDACRLGLSKWCDPGDRPPATRTPLDESLAGLTELFEEGRTYKDYPRVVWPEMGFSAVISNDVDDEDDLAGPLMNVGAFDNFTSVPNHIWFDLPNRRLDTGADWTAQNIRDILRAIVESWDARFAVVTVGDYYPLIPRKPNDHYIWPWPFWITYLASPHPALVRTPSTIRIDDLPNDGAIWTLCEERFDSSNPAHRERLREMQEAFAPVQKNWTASAM